MTPRDLLLARALRMEKNTGYLKALLSMTPWWRFLARRSLVVEIAQREKLSRHIRIAAMGRDPT